MNIEQLCEEEKRRIDKMHLQLPNIYKKVGIIVFSASMIILISTKFIDGETETFKMILRQLIIASMLVMAISKEKIEDEMILKIRHRAFTIAFIWAVIYALVQPYINYAVAMLLSSEKAVYKDFGAFIVLWFMLAIYLLYFHVMKRMA
jgi:hypothetical protein